MAVCGICDSKIDERKDASIGCIRCKKWIHKKCANVTEDRFELEAKLSQKREGMFVCERCNLTSKNELASKLGSILDDLKTLKTNEAIMFETNASIEESMKLINESFETCKSDVNGIKKQLESMKLMEVQSSIHKLEISAEATEQYLRRNNVEIHGIPNLQSEDVYQIVEQVSTALGTDITKANIDVAHRLKSRSPNLPEAILVKFTQRWLKEDLIERSKKKRITTEDLGIPGPKRNIYLSPHLSPNQKILHRRARHLRHYGFNFVWISRDNKIWIRRSENERAICIMNEEILASLEAQAAKSYPGFKPLTRDANEADSRM